MNINVIRRLDQYLGPIICRFLLFISFYKKSLKLSNPSVQKEYKNILIIKFFGIGSILLASPTLMQLKKKYCSVEITIFTLFSNREICEMLPSLDHAIYLNIRTFWSFLKTFTKAIIKIRKKHFDAVIDLEFLTFFSAMVTLLTTVYSNSKMILGFNSPIKWRNRIHNINISFDHSKHITKIFAKVVNGLGVDGFEVTFESEKTALLKHADKEYMKRLVEKNNHLEKCDCFVCININAGELSLNRRWPKEHFRILVKELLSESRIGIILIGGKDDVDYVTNFEKELGPLPQIINLSGKTSIKQLIGLLSKMKLLITNDSGPLHFAQILEIPTISFFGPETPHLYGPLGDKHLVFYEDMFCSPCLNIYNAKNSFCKDNRCMKAITPEKVINIVKGSIRVFQKDKLQICREIISEEKLSMGAVMALRQHRGRGIG